MGDSLDYHLLDVFTTAPLTGNPLAVFVDQGITDSALMHRIARELNLSETVFVSSPSDIGGAFPTRIFTPGTELPFAGHPTVGTAVLLASLGLVEGDEVVLAENVGDVCVAVHHDQNGWNAELTTATLPRHVQTIDRVQAAAAISLSVDELHPDLTPAIWDCGVPFAVIGVRDIGSLRKAAIAPVLEQSVYAVAPNGDRWRARCFATTFGIGEDPATGSACAAFAGFVADAFAEPNVFVVDQGVEMGRASELRLSFDRDAHGAPSAVRVAGGAVVVGRGSLLL